MSGEHQVTANMSSMVVAALCQQGAPQWQGLGDYGDNGLMESLT